MVTGSGMTCIMVNPSETPQGDEISAQKRVRLGDMAIRVEGPDLY